MQSGWRRVWCDKKGQPLLCPEEGAVPLLGPGGSTQPGWAARPWVPLCFLSSVPQAPMYLVGQQTLSLVLASRLKGQVPPTGAQSHQGRGCSHQEGVLFLFIIKLLGTLQCSSLVSSCLVPGREAVRSTQMSTGVEAKAARPSRGGSYSLRLPAGLCKPGVAVKSWGLVCWPCQKAGINLGASRRPCASVGLSKMAVLRLQLCWAFWAS